MAYEVIPGDTLNLSSVLYANLLKYLKSCVFYKKVNGVVKRKLWINAVAIDMGYRGPTVVSFTRKVRSKTIYCVRGNVNSRDPTPMKRTKEGYSTYLCDVDYFKNTLFELLTREQIGAGYCHFGKHNTKKYFQMLTAEEKIKASTYKGYKFEKIQARNEALDCRVYAMAAAWQWGLTNRLIRAKKDSVLVDNKKID